MNTGFVLTGLLTITAVLLVLRRRRGTAAVSVVITTTVFGAGISLVGIFHGSAAAGADGILWLHFLGAFAAIGGGNLTLILVGARRRSFGLSRATGIVSLTAGITGLLALPLPFVLEGIPAGAVERVSVYTIVLFQLLLGGVLTARNRGATP